ncbi:unnamed protein product [Paramecium octaurelia]|uniref:Uncharacterized protein n=1 Tax=Paramecium octaurelia TaxID=43137 RepID=A0A8S1TQJ4_PAROT|nr:unnamed protein product [Paramecium octaurelia]
MNFYEVIEHEDNYVVMKVSKEQFLMFQSMIQSQMTNEVNQVDGVSQDFSRRIVPFFMNQFSIWAKQTNDNSLASVSTILQKLKDEKRSNQKKFELGDLKKIFNPKNSKKYKLVKEAWEAFLSSRHIRDCIQRNQKTKPGSRIQYMVAIQILINELQRPFPYDKFLSKYKKAYQNRILPAEYIQPFSEFCSQSMYQEDENSTIFILGGSC